MFFIYEEYALYEKKNAAKNTNMEINTTIINTVNFFCLTLFTTLKLEHLVVTFSTVLLKFIGSFKLV